MKTRPALVGFLLVLCCCRSWAQLPEIAPPRAWKIGEKPEFSASLVSFDGAAAVLRLSNGQRITTPLEQFRAEDQTYLAGWREQQPLKIVVPDVVGVEMEDINVEVVSEDERNEKFVYRTRHFEFESQGKFTQSLLREVARNFEATYELVKALPWGIEPEPPSGELFRARLLRTTTAYEAEGAPRNSGGVYLRNREMFLVPFESLGLKVVGRSYAKDHDFESHTLVHELTHQMMHFWLGYLPQWVIEGTAEYTGILPLRAGRFRVSAAKNGLKDYLDLLKRSGQNGVPEPYPLEELLFITNKKWNEILETDPRQSARLYFTSYLLVYYFMHLDGKGDGQLLARYFREVGAAKKEVVAYFEAREELKQKPGTEVRPDGTVWQDGVNLLSPPALIASAEARDEFQRKSLEILLDGRNAAELTKQIRAAYAKLGIRL